MTFREQPGTMYGSRDAEVLGRRRVCYREGHLLVSNVDKGTTGGVQWGRRPGDLTAASDKIECERCDAVITVEYPAIGRVVT